MISSVTNPRIEKCRCQDLLELFWVVYCYVDFYIVLPFALEIDVKVINIGSKWVFIKDAIEIFL